MRFPKFLLLCISLTFYVITNGQSSDSVIKTTFRYFITTDRTDSIVSRNLNYQSEYFTMSHFKSLRDSENFNKILSTLQRRLKQAKPNFFYRDIDTRDWVPSIDNSIEVDTINRAVYAIHQEVEGKDTFRFGNLSGLDFNMEWLYNIRSNKIAINIPYVYLRWHLIPISKGTEAEDWGYGELWYHAETSSENNMEAVLNDSVVWGKAFNMFLVKDSNQSENLYPYSKYTEQIGSISSKCVVNNEENLKKLFDNSLVDWIYKQVTEGKLPAYKYTPDSSTATPLTLSELFHLTQFVDTVLDENGNSIVAVGEIPPSLHSGLLVEEELIFHPSSFKFEMKITRATVISFKNSNSYDSRQGNLPLFWVKFE